MTPNDSKLSTESRSSYDKYLMHGSHCTRLGYFSCSSLLISTSITAKLMMRHAAETAAGNVSWLPAVQSDVHQWLYTRLGVDRSPATEPNVKCTYSTMTRLWLHRLFVWSNSLTGPPTTGSAAGLSVPRPGGRRRHRDAESWYSLLDALNCCLLNIISRADLIAMMTIIQNTSTCCLFLSRTLSSDTTAGTALRVFKIARYPDAANSHAVRA